MEITTRNNTGYTDLIITSENTKIVEDVYDYKSKDVRDDTLSTLGNALSNLLYYRIESWNDGKEVIDQLLTKLGDTKKQELLEYLQEYFR